MKPLKAKEIYKNWATLLSPINSSEEIDYPKLRDELDYLTAGNLNTIYHPCAQIPLERLKRSRALQPKAIQVILPDWFPVTVRKAKVFDHNGEGYFCRELDYLIIKYKYNYI